MATKVFTKTKTATNTGVTVALAFLAVSAAFAAAAFSMNQKYAQKMMPQSSSSKPAMDAGKPGAENKIMPTKEKSSSLLTAVLSPYEDYPSALVVAPSSNVRMLQIAFSAQGESFMIHKIRLMNIANPIVNPLGSTDPAISQLKISYPKQDGSTGMATAILNNQDNPGVADISGLDMFVRQNSTVPLNVMADMADPVVSRIYNRILTPRIGIDFGVPGDTNFEAVGMTTGRSLTTASDLAIFEGIGNPLPKQPDILGNLMYAVKSKPTVVLASNSPSGPPPSNGEVLRFLVSANPTGGVELSRVTFKVNSTDNANSGWNKTSAGTYDIISCRIQGGRACRDFAPNNLTAADFLIYDGDDPSVPLDGMWMLYSTSEGGGWSNIPAQVGYATFDFMYNHVIAAGTTKTFVVKVGTNASRSQHDSFRLDVLGDSPEQFINSHYSTNFVNDGSMMGPRFVWGETGAKAVTATRAASASDSTGLTGYLVKNLDVIGGTLVY